MVTLRISVRPRSGSSSRASAYERLIDGLQNGLDIITYISTNEREHELFSGLPKHAAKPAHFRGAGWLGFAACAEVERNSQGFPPTPKISALPSPNL
jgi:hypothetical protein